METNTNVIYHIPHIENLIFDSISGKFKAEKILLDLIDTLKGKNSSVKISLKFDGSPSILFGSINNKFFIAYKGVLTSSNKKDKIFFSIEDIEQYFRKNKGTDSNLESKYKNIFLSLLQYKFSGTNIYQGDLLFLKEDVFVLNLEDSETKQKKNYICFRPNVLVYAFDEHSDTAKDILSSNIGIAVHTKYELKDEENFILNKIDADVDFEKELPSKNAVLFFYANLKLVDPKLIIDEEEYNSLTKKINKLSNLNYYYLINIFNSSDEELFSLNSNKVFGNYSTSKNSNLIKNILIKYINNELIINRRYPSIEAFYTYYKNFIEESFESLKTKYKRKDTIDAKISLLNDIVNKTAVIISNTQFKSDLKNFFKWYNEVIDIKNYIIKKISILSSGIRGYFTKDNEFKFSSDEGYVVKDFENNVIKLVDRLNFTSINFSQDVEKGWNKQ